MAPGLREFSEAPWGEYSAGAEWIVEYVVAEIVIDVDANGLSTAGARSANEVQRDAMSIQFPNRETARARKGRGIL
jgi:hypothetical protein